MIDYFIYAVILIVFAVSLVVFINRLFSSNPRKAVWLFIPILVLLPFVLSIGLSFYLQYK